MKLFFIVQATKAWHNSLKVQARVIGALMLRELVTRFGRNNLGALWLVLEPMIFTLVIAFMWEAMNLKRSTNISIVAFAVTGYSSVLMWRNTVSHSLGAIQSNTNLLFHRNVKVLDVMIARSLLEVAGATSSFLALSVLFCWLGLMALPYDLLQVLVSWALLGWFGVSLGILVGSATAYSALAARLWVPIGYILFPLSGAAYMADWLPKGVRETLLLLPMVHANELLREGFFGPITRYHYDVNYLLICNLLISLAGMLLASFAARRVGAS